MKKPGIALLALGLAVFTGNTAFGQYYLQDIYNTQKTVANMQALKNANVATQTVQSLDANLQSDDDFVCIRTISNNFRQMRSVTRSRSTGLSILTSTFGPKGQLNKITDSTGSSINITQYRYVGDALVNIQTVSQARDEKFKMTETRSYTYDSLLRPVQMVRRKNNSADSSIVLFKLDEAGRVIEELEAGKNIRSQRIYYNYDAQGRLTDVMRYQPVKKRMVPDYLFEYDAQGRLAQMTTVNATTSDYTVWKYSYDAKGLPLKEDAYAKGNELLGMIRYKYEFNK
ncbi:hypothetical protein MKQ70_01710 [Chitinophaga sedimenti]|uniref:RHS repeat domain-containing protein n=1 Tax=Chitinophaga sedimenti TaxID=2033606 RepID=UPI002002DABD|nr:hypothetical protein [Chitinophaga sedimenti]MCK7553787.1 hypothetical protein [Chitinophaga sedimenti]